MRNLFIFVADSLRYDHAPSSIVSAGRLVKTLAPSLNTPASFTSLVTARSPENHNVTSFFDSLDFGTKTVFDVFKDGSYYDHPNDPMCKIVLRNCPNPKPLTEMEEPFVWVERAMETHIPYGRIKHGNETKYTKEGGLWGKEYVCALESGQINAVREYARGVKGVEKHFWDHVDELKSMDVYRKTLIVFTSDHGELLGEYGRFIHNYPPCRELVEVPTVFLNTKLNVEFMRSIDIVPTAFGILGLERLRGWDGVDVRKEKPKKGVNLVEGRVLTIWTFNDGKIRLTRYYKKVGSFIWIPMSLSMIMLNRKLSQILHKTSLIEKLEY